MWRRVRGSSGRYLGAALKPSIYILLNVVQGTGVLAAIWVLHYNHIYITKYGAGYRGVSRYLGAAP